MAKYEVKGNYLLEDGAQIAKLSLDRIPGLVPQIKFKWFSERAMYRFCDFADSLTMAETVEALGFEVRYSNGAAS